jgi:hypothetical protein
MTINPNDINENKNFIIDNIIISIIIQVKGFVYFSIIIYILNKIKHYFPLKQIK